MATAGRHDDSTTGASLGLSQLEMAVSLLPFPAVGIVEPPNGTIVFANDAAGDLIGLDAAEVVGRRGFDFLAPDLRSAVAPGMQKVAHRGNRYETFRMRIRHVDGRMIPVELMVSPTVVDGIEVFLLVLDDVTLQVASQRAVALSEERFRLTFDFAPVGMALVAPDGHFLDTNRALCSFFAMPRAQLLSRTWQELTHPDDLALDGSLCASLLAGDRDHYELEKRYRRSDGETIWGRLNVSIARTPEGEPLHLISQILDITDTKHAVARLEAVAASDPLTGLANRRTVERWAPPEDGSGVVAVIFADLDGFKRVNDEHGHHVGDELLRQVAERLATTVRPQDHLARVGGDEFVVLCSVDDASAAVGVADRVREVLTRPFRLSVGAVTVGVSVGVASGGAGTHVDTLLRTADAVMYSAKHHGQGLLHTAIE